MTPEKVFKSKKIIFWDFDGVIKESVGVKNEVFAKLFHAYDNSVLEKIKTHHLSNGGMSRFEKFPLYLAWADEKCTPDAIDQLNLRFNSMAVDGVLNSSWVPGVERILTENPYKQIFILISATPEIELVDIVKQLGIYNCFKFIYGYPSLKSKVIGTLIEECHYKLNDCIMIGDSIIDYEAALDNKIDFLLRQTNDSSSFFTDYQGYSINNFEEI